jgi:hypothetical protein
MKLRSARALRVPPIRVGRLFVQVVEERRRRKRRRRKKRKRKWCSGWEMGNRD